MTNDLSERIIAAALFDAVDSDTAATLMEIHCRVIRDLFCPITGKILDSRTAHLIRATFGDDDPITAGVIHPSATDRELTKRLGSAGATLVERFDPATAWASIR